MGFTYFVLVTALAAQIAVPPQGFRFPNERDYSADWKIAAPGDTPPFVVNADFNGDNLPDEAWLLPAATARGWGLFVFLGVANGSPRVVRLEGNQDSEVDGFGVALAEPGKHKTACGKGYWQCERDEPEVLNLKFPAIEFFRFESASSIFWWDVRTATFKRTWISD